MSIEQRCIKKFDGFAVTSAHEKCMRCGTTDRKTKRGVHKDVHGAFCEDTFMCEWDAWGQDEQNVKLNQAALNQKAKEAKAKQAKLNMETRKIFGLDQTKDFYHHKRGALDLLQAKEYVYSEDDVFDWVDRMRNKRMEGPH